MFGLLIFRGVMIAGMLITTYAFFRFLTDTQRLIDVVEREDN
jgi:hypothetical protein